MLGLVAFCLSFLLSCLTNYSTVSLSLLEVRMVKKHSIIALSMFANGVVINLFSTQLVAVQT
ncbi:hypothetical protein K3F61_14740 [Acinetobacter baumannii]|nr:hypothetical protein [Acinetobacter baumannii]ELW96944.1 hypothetical protein ACINNAV78_1747 [Acinetobacter baumannii Naval-78]EYD40795.1 putative membrane protein [Acinetobacter baumannii 25493_5]EYD46403.1 putative membrane protein [Acinetobacter baumannii 25493_4]EYU48662.1 putative membrane protein [Acinetobacter baumannii 1457504]